MIQDYLLEKMKNGDVVAYSLYRVAHEDEIAKIDELNNFSKIKIYLQSHTDLKSPSDNPFFDPKVIYFAEVLGGRTENYGVMIMAQFKGHAAKYSLPIIMSDRLRKITPKICSIIECPHHNYINVTIPILGIIIYNITLLYNPSTQKPLP